MLIVINQRNKVELTVQRQSRPAL